MLALSSSTVESREVSWLVCRPNWTFQKTRVDLWAAVWMSVAYLIYRFFYLRSDIPRIRMGFRSHFNKEKGSCMAATLISLVQICFVICTYLLNLFAFLSKFPVRDILDFLMFGGKYVKGFDLIMQMFLYYCLNSLIRITFLIIPKSSILKSHVAVWLICGEQSFFLQPAESGSWTLEGFESCRVYAVEEGSIVPPPLYQQKQLPSV